MNFKKHREKLVKLQRLFTFYLAKSGIPQQFHGFFAGFEIDHFHLISGASYILALVWQ